MNHLLSFLMTKKKTYLSQAGLHVYMYQIMESQL